MNLEKRVQRRAATAAKQQKNQDWYRRFPLLGTALVVALLGLIFEMRNMFSVWRTLEEYPNAPFWDVFFSTIGEDGEESIILWGFVWIPIIALGVAIVLVLLHLIIGGPIRRRAEAAIAEEVAVLERARQSWQPGAQPQGAAHAGGFSQPGGPQGDPYQQGAPYQGAPYQQGAPQQGAPYQSGSPQQGAPYQGGAPQQGAPYQGGAPQQGAPYQGGAPQQGAPYQGGAPQQGAPYQQPGAPQQP